MDWNILLQQGSFDNVHIFNAFIVFILGFFISVWIKNMTILFFQKIRFNQALERVGWTGVFEKLEMVINFSHFGGSIIQIFFILLFLMISMEIFGLALVSALLEKVIVYYPNIIISLMIFVISVYLIDFSQKIVVGTKKMEKITYSRFLGKAIDISIRTLAVLAICYQLAIVPQLILVIFIGFILTVSLSFGISMGLAGKEPMVRFLREIKKSLTG